MRSRNTVRARLDLVHTYFFVLLFIAMLGVFILRCNTIFAILNFCFLNVLVGITLYSKACGKQDINGIYTAVSNELCFIHFIIECLANNVN